MTQTMSYRDAINTTLAEEMRRDQSVFCIGEDIAHFGGALKVTEGLFDEFGGSRVIDTPIAEAGFVGLALGAAMTGLRPVVEVMYNDFLLLAMDQLVNQAAKVRYMYGGKVVAPLVVRTHAGAGRGNAAQHSQSLHNLFVHVPGLVVMAPSTPADARGLLRTAIRGNTPVLFFENKLIYGSKGPVPDGDYEVPISKADVKRVGADVTIVATSRMVLFALSAADELAKSGIEADVIDPRTLKPLDMKTISASVRKTGRVVVVDEGCRTSGFTAEVAARVMDEDFDFLDGPVVRVASVDAPVPYSPALEIAAFPQPDTIIDAVRSFWE